MDIKGKAMAKPDDNGKPLTDDTEIAFQMWGVPSIACYPSACAGALTIMSLT